MTGTTSSATESGTYGVACRVESEGVDVVARKVFTRMGERLEVAAPALGESIRLDAIMLESVAWQSRDDLEDAASTLPATDATAESENDSPLIDEMASVEDVGEFTVSNEFAFARITPGLEEGRGVFRIDAPKLGYTNTVGARELAWLATRSHETFTEWLETPFGPGEDHH